MLLLLLAALQADTVRYDIRFPNAVHHEAEVTVTFPARRGDTLAVWMSRSSPGRYALHEFAKNVYSVRAEDLSGEPLTVVQPDPYHWLVVTEGGPVKFEYTLFGDRTDGTYAGIDRTHAHLNLPAVFAFAPDLESLPIAVHFELPSGSGWRVATQLIPTTDSTRYTAPDLQYFMDSPAELSNFTLRSWTVPKPGGGTYTIRLALHHTGTDAEADAYVERMQRVIAEQVGVYGEPAPYDGGTYTFLADYLPWASGDGMEHRNSTIITSATSLARNPMGILSTMSHEFFHSWNMERIRSAQIEPFDFLHADPSDALWFGEGFTNYFDQLFIRRAGITDDATYLRRVAGQLDDVLHSPARRYRSPLDVSRTAPFVDAATSIDPTNFGNTFLSYYTWGAGIGTGLDLTIRGRYPGKTLDGFMRLMWQRFGRNERPFVVKRPYTVDDIQRTLGEYVGDPAFAADFFRRYVRGREVMDYAVLLAQAGVLLRPAHPDAAWVGDVRLRPDSGGVLLVSQAIVGTPLYAAGLDRGDLIVSLGGTPVASDSAWRESLASRKPGETVDLVFEERGQRRTASVTIAADPELEAVTFESVGQQLTDAERAFRAAWLGSRAGK
jgi:predicted metalloprotease with PDZ domain